VGNVNMCSCVEVFYVGKHQNGLKMVLVIETRSR
jgi:hypothetical protein